MQINSLSALYEIYMYGTQIASMAIKGDIKLPYEWQYIGSYFCLNVEYDLQGCLYHLRFKSCFHKWHCAVLVSFPVRIMSLNLLGSLEYVAVLLNLLLGRVSILSPHLFLGRVCLLYQWRRWATGGCWQAERGVVEEPWRGARTLLVLGRRAWPDHGGIGKSGRELPAAPEWAWSTLFKVWAPTERRVGVKAVFL